MNAARHQRISEIFLAAARAEFSDRVALLDSHCGDDFDLRREVESLLSHHDETSSTLDNPVLGSRLRLADLAAEDAGVAHAADIPRQIARYRILDILGEGGMGVVYLAEQDNPRRTVALKVIRPGVATGRALRRFELETQVLGRLRHPGIAQIFEAGMGESPTSRGPRAQPYFAMEYVRGQPLMQYVTAASLSIPQRLALFAEICQAVHHAHQHGVVHRDLKPSNILVDELGRPKILDFGVARSTDADLQTTTLQTEIGQLIGTIPYMSPEQALGDAAQVDARSDVYSLGALLYELLTGRVPHDLRRRTIPDAVRAIANDEPPPLSAIDRALRGDLSTIAAKALDKDPARRYQSASELALDVRRFLDDQPIIARPASVIYQLGKFTRRNRVLVGGIVAVFVVLVAGLIVSGASLLRARAAETDALARMEESQHETRKARAFSDFLYHMLTTRGPGGTEGLDISLMTQRLDAAAVEVKTVLADLPEVRAAVQQTIGEAYQALGLYDQARVQLEEALSERTRLLGPDHLDVATSLFALGMLLQERADHRAAEPLYREALATRIRHLGPEHAEVLRIMNQLALCMIEDDDGTNLREAGELCRATLAARRRLCPPVSDEIAFSLLTLSIVLRDEGDLVAAEAALRESMEIIAALYGKDDTHYAGILLNLGSTLRRQGRLEPAEEALREGLAIRRRALGDHHTALTWGMLQLAWLLSEQGRFHEAEAMCRDAIAIRTDRLGAEHDQVTDAMQVLAEVFAAADRKDEARLLGLEVLQRLRRARGDEHRGVKQWAERVKAFTRSRAEPDPSTGMSIDRRGEAGS